MNIRSAIHDEKVRESLRDRYYKDMWNMEEFLMSPSHMIDMVRHLDYPPKYIKNLEDHRDKCLDEYPIKIKHIKEYLKILNYYD